MLSQSKYGSMKMFIMHTYIILTMLVGCNIMNKTSSENISFESLCGLTHSEFESMNSEQMDQWMRKKHGSNISVESSGDNQNIVTTYRWVETSSKGAAYRKDNHLLHISATDIDSGPTFGQVVSSLGKPDVVYRDVEAREKVLYTVGLDYPRLGVSVSTSDLANVADIVHENGWAIQLKESMKVDSISCYTPHDSMEQVLINAFLSTPSSVQIQLKHRTPWPGFGSWVSLDNLP